MIGVRGSRPVVSGLRPRLLAIQLLETIMPEFDQTISTGFRENSVSTLFNGLASVMWAVPSVMARDAAEAKFKELDNKLHKLNSLGIYSKMFLTSFNHLFLDPGVDSQGEMIDVSFDSEKCVFSCVENGDTVTHESGVRGYALANTPITSGCYQWKFHIVKENKGNEGTCVGVAKWPIKDYSHRSTSDMWLYRAYR